MSRDMDRQDRSDQSPTPVVIEKPDISIVIVNWNARDFLRDCLCSITDETSRPHQTIVVDNASNDGSVDLIRREFGDAIVIANETNRGFAAANNQGLRIATGRYMLLLNPDTIVLDGAIDKMVAWCDEHPDVGCAGCQVMETETAIQRTCFTDPSALNTLLIETGLHRLFPRSRLFGYPFYSWWDRRSEREVNVVSGMFMLIPRRVLEKIGFLDEAFFVYAEEADLCRRIREAGWRCVFAPVARILHREGGGMSTGQIKPRMHVQLQKSLLTYVRKHDGALGLFLMKTIFVVSNCARWTVFGAGSLLSGSTKMRARAHLAQISLAYHILGVEPTS